MGKQWNQWETLFSWAPKSLQVVTVAMKLRDACCLEKSYDRSIDSILKSRNITLQTKVHLVKAMIFPVVMYGCESWTTKTEHRRIVAFDEWWWRWLESPLGFEESKPVLQEINPEYSLEGWMLKLKLQYVGHLMRRAYSLGKTLMLGKIEGRRRRVWQSTRGWMASLTWWTWVWASSRRW